MKINHGRNFCARKKIGVFSFIKIRTLPGFNAAKSSKGN
jgi:hypothetical protein